MAEITNAQSREDILRRLMDEYELPVRRMCCVYLRDEHMAADAVQETFLNAYLALDKFRGDCSEKTWLMRIAINTCHSIRRNSWMRYVDRRITLDKLPEPAENADYGLSELTLDIMRLPQKLIDVVLLHDYHGLTIRETAQLLDIPYQTANSRLQKAHRILRIVLSDEGGTQS